MTKDPSLGALSVIVRSARAAPNPWIWEMVDARGAFAGRSHLSYETEDEARNAGYQAKAALSTPQT